jgi:hypothetical protein
MTLDDLQRIMESSPLPLNYSTISILNQTLIGSAWVREWIHQNSPF